jgi:ribosomal RNA-processing protein 17
VNALIKEANGVVDDGDEDAGSGTEGEDKEWTGFEEPPAINHEAEYVDEDKYTTVTVESVNISRDGFDRAEDESEVGSAQEGSESKDNSGQATANAQSTKKRTWTKKNPKSTKPKKKKKFRYEAPAERKASRMRERSKGKEQAKARRAAK